MEVAPWDFSSSQVSCSVKVPGFRSGTVCVCVCVWYLHGERWVWGQWERERPPGAEWQGLIWRHGRALLSFLFRSKSRHNAICCWVPSLLHRMRFGFMLTLQTGTSCCSMLFMEIKCQEQSPRVPQHPDTHPDGVLGWSLEGGEDWGAATRRELQGWSWSVSQAEWHQLGGKYWCTLFVFEPEVWVLHTYLHFKCFLSTRVCMLGHRRYPFLWTRFSGMFSRLRKTRGFQGWAGCVQVYCPPPHIPTFGKTRQNIGIRKYFVTFLGNVS